MSSGATGSLCVAPVLLAAHPNCMALRVASVAVVAVAPEGVIAAYVNGWVDPVNHIGDFGLVGHRRHIADAD